MGRKDLEDPDDDPRVANGSRLRLLNERGVAVDEETEYESGGRVPMCTVTCCGFMVGALTLAIISALALFVVLTFAVSYPMLDNGLCGPNEIGIGRVCVSCPNKNATPEEAARACAEIGAEVARFGVIKAFVDRLRTFAPSGASDYITVARMSESSTTCVKATASGASSVDCPDKAAAVCQRPRPLGPLQESIRRTRVSMGAESEDLYSRHAFMFTDSA